MTTEPDFVRYNFEYEQKIRVAFIGAGGHAFRNVYPTFQYAPIDLVAICDIDAGRAAAYARQFGATATYTDHREMLAQEQPDAVFIVTNYDEHGKPRATQLALDALNAGCHVWMEKPTAASVAEVRQLIATSEQTGKFVLTGLKKTFFPSIVRTKEIIDSPEFGEPVSVAIRYPQSMPPPEDRGDLTQMLGLLDHLPHPVSILHELLGPVASLTYEWEARRGGSVSNLVFRSGAIGTMHLVGGGSGSSPLERLEVVGEHANVVVENGVRVIYYRPARRGGYGRAASYLVPTDDAPLIWEPEFSLGQLYNKNIFYLGYVPEVLHFCESVLENTPPTKGTLAASLEIAKLFEAYRTNPPGTRIAIDAG
jgi:predicted dehydrogenase